MNATANPTPETSPKEPLQISPGQLLAFLIGLIVFAYFASSLLDHQLDIQEVTYHQQARDIDEALLYVNGLERVRTLFSATGPLKFRNVLKFQNETLFLSLADQPSNEHCHRVQMAGPLFAGASSSEWVIECNGKVAARLQASPADDGVGN
jgi:hypothetical protein